MDKNSTKKPHLPKARLSEADAQKLDYLVNHYYLDVTELIKFLIRKEHGSLNLNVKTTVSTD